MDPVRPNVPSPFPGGQNWLEVVRQHVESLRFGTVEIVVHDSRVTQIEKTERVRFEKGGAPTLAESTNSPGVSKSSAERR